MKRIYFNGRDGLHIEGSRDDIATLLNCCRAALDSRDGRATNVLLQSGQGALVMGQLLGQVRLTVEIVDK